VTTTTLETLRACRTRASLKAAWLALTEAERNELRPDRTLAAHAWGVLKRDPA
jgi:hypothetical protein